MLLSTLLLLILASLTSARIEGQNDYGGNARRVNVADTDVLQIYQKWVDTGLSSLMAAVADKRLKKQRSFVAQQFGQCSNKADSIPKQARCVNDLLQNRLVGEEERRRRLKTTQQRLERYGLSKSTEDKWTGPFRMEKKRKKRELPVSRSQYNLLPANGQITPLGGIAKLILQSVLEKRNKTVAPNWQKTIQRLKESADRKKTLRKRLEDDSQESMDQMAMRGLKQMMPKDGLNTDDLHDRQKITEMIKKARTKKPKNPEEYMMHTLREGMKLGYMMAGQNTSNFDEKSVKMVSPRFFGLVPEEKQPDEVNLLSPSLFSLHKDGEGIENITSVFSLLQGLPLKDQHIWLDMIMEAAGVNDAADKMETEVVEEERKQTEGPKQNTTLQIFNPGKLKDEHGTPLYFEKHNASRIGGTFEERKIQTFETLHQSYTKEQLHAMNTTGYAYMSKEQLYHLYGPHSPYNNSQDLHRFLAMDESRMDDYLEKDIETISQVEKFQVRQKDIVLSPILFTWLTLVPGLASQPLILSPVAFSPLILSPSVFGAVILSPWIFIPLVLSPRILGALLLSPFIFSPLILTPLVLHPGILSPGIFNPIILSPAVLTPIILSPQVFTPIILTPLVLSPIILNPLVGSPLILSPFVLTPIIASPQVLGGLILSPYVLSPVILSPLIAFVAVLSPSFLS